MQPPVGSEGDEGSKATFAGSASDLRPSQVAQVVRHRARGLEHPGPVAWVASEAQSPCAAHKRPGLVRLFSWAVFDRELLGPSPWPRGSSFEYSSLYFAAILWMVACHSRTCNIIAKINCICQALVYYRSYSVRLIDSWLAV